MLRVISRPFLPVQQKLGSHLSFTGVNHVILDEGCANRNRGQLRVCVNRVNFGNVSIQNVILEGNLGCVSIENVI